MQQVNLDEKTLEELKALAYDQILNIEQSKMNLKLIEEQIQRRNIEKDDLKNSE